MNILVLNGSPKEKSDTMRMTKSFVEGILSEKECEINIIDVIKKNIRPCIGCFGCWIKTPGQCVIPDAYQTMARRIHAADEVVVCTKWTYGGFSPFVKNVFDRSIGVVLPFFEIVDGEMHHQKRYAEVIPMTVHFRGSGLD